MGYIAGLTALRGLAAWWVVFFHSREFLPASTPAALRMVIARGYLAVDLFFVLSGFVVALSYGWWFPKLEARAIFRFYGQRLARIYPLHLFVLLLFLGTACAAGLLANKASVIGHHDTGYFFLSLFLVQNWGFTHSLQWNGPAWSISTELAAYLTFPFVAVALPHFAKSFARLALCALVPLAALALYCWTLNISLAGAVLQGGVIRCVLEFWSGVCLLHLHALRPSIGRSSAAPIALLALCGLAGVVAFGWPDYLLCPLSFALLIFALADPSLRMPSTLAWKMAEWFGKVSYSTYLVHFLLKDLVKLVAIRHGVPELVPLSVYVPSLIAASAVLYYTVEVPGRIYFQNLVAWGAGVWAQRGARRLPYANNARQEQNLGDRRVTAAR